MALNDLLEALENGETVTPVTPQNISAEDWVLFNAWLFHFIDHEALPVLFVPAVDHAAALSCYPDAVAAEPMPEAGQHAATETARDEIPDDRRTCRQCQRLRGRVCIVAKPGGLVSANRGYQPNPDTLQRCAGYLPNDSDTDQRTGLDRWPGMSYVKGSK